MPISTWDELPIQDERLSPYNLPNQINPIRGAATMFGLEVLNNVATYKSLANTATNFVKDAYDGHFSESPEVSEPLSAQSLERVKKFYPELQIGKEASQEQVQAGIDRIEREKAMEYLDQHASPGFASSAAIFGGGVAGSFTDIGALLGTKWITKGISKGSELLAAKTAESAVTRLGGTASVRAQQLIADNAGSIAFLKGGAGLAGFTGIEELERIGSARLSHVQTPNEADFRLMDGVFDMASSGLVGGVLGLSAEKLTGKMVDKSFVIPSEEDFLYRGRSMRPDLAAGRLLRTKQSDEEFGKGYWFAETKEHAKFYGSSVQKFKKGMDYKLFEVGVTEDKELHSQYKDMQKKLDAIADFEKTEPEKKSKEWNAQHKIIDKEYLDAKHLFINSVKGKGFDGMMRKEGYADDFGKRTTKEGKNPVAKNEIMFFENPKNLRRKAEMAEHLKNIHMMGIDGGAVSEKLKKSAQVVKAFFQSSKEETERETLDNVSQSYEAGKEPHNDYIFEVNRHEAWKRLQQYMSDAQLWPDEFIDTLESQRPDLLAAIEEDNPSMDSLQQFMTNEALIDLAKRTEDEVIPSDEAKASYLKSMRDNYVPLDDVSAPYMDTENLEGAHEPDALQSRIDAFGDEEMQDLADEGNRFAKQAIGRKALLGHEENLRNLLTQYAGNIMNDLIETGVFDEGALRELIENINHDDAAAFEELLEANKPDIQFMVDRIVSIVDQLKGVQDRNAGIFTPEQLTRAIDNEFKFIKAQVIRSQRDAIAFENKKRVLANAVEQLDTKDGNALRQAMNALLDRSLLQFKGANEGTFRKMNDAEQLFKAEFTRLLDDKKTMEFWNDTNSSSEITRALFAHDMDLPMDEFSEPAKKIAEMVNTFYDLAVDLYAKEGILIPKLKGRIHHQWHNPYRILKMPWRDRLRMSLSERREFQFQRWFDFIKDKIDLVKTFDTDVLPEEGEPAYIDINDETQVKDFFKRTFDKIVERDYRREKTNLLTKRSRQRVLQFKSPEDFAEYTKRFGAGDAQSAVLRELTSMFREVELVKDWGAEPEKMLEDVLEHAATLPGWKDYSLRKDAETPRRLMHLMRFGAAHSTSEWGMMFSELVYNLKAYESVTKLGNLFFLNAGDGLVAANALNRFSIPMQESMAKSIKETFSRYTPQEQQDLLRMFGIAKSQYFGGFYRHFEDGTLSTRLSKMLRITMKITGTENSEYSNRSMIGQVLSNWFATHVQKMDFESLDKTSKGTLSRYDIGADEWAMYRDAVRNHEGNDYIGWDTVHEISDQKIRDYLHNQGVKYVTQERVEITRDDLAQKYRLLMQDQMDDAVNRKSLTETDLLRFKRDPTSPSPINDAINMFMLFKTYGFMWIRRHLGDRIYGRGATGFRVSQIQGTADWHGLMKLMMLSFAMELGINQMKSLANDRKTLPFDGSTAMDALIGSLGPISYLTRIDGSNLLASITRMAAGPIGADAEKIARIATQFERGFWKGDYSNAQVNSIKFLASQFGGVPMLKSAIMTLWADNAIQNIKGKRVGHIIDNVEANQQ